MAETDPLCSDRKPEPLHGNGFFPHETGEYYLAAVDTIGTIKLFAKDLQPPVRGYSITSVRFELDADTGKWIWFDGTRNQSPRRSQNGWRLGSKQLHDTRAGAEAELQREMVKNGDRVTKVHDLPDDMTALRKIRSAHHPDRNNADADQELYQAVIEKLDRMRRANQSA
ncbi:MAG TPA: hypothetical protein VFN66_05410 [Burkholderiales bacterium]|nr:hypothetical protein [Burkholderiales bacterium]